MFKKVDKKNSNYGDFIKNHLPSAVVQYTINFINISVS